MTSYNAVMNSQESAFNLNFSDDDVRVCMRVLRAIEADRAQLIKLTQETRRELLLLAGLVTKPERHEVSRMLKGFRRAKREATKQHDKNLVERSGLRIQRRSPVYSPLWLERPQPEVGQQTVQFRQERNCYICKQSFSSMHRFYDSMCETCGEFNYLKREQTADLSGQYALITGARVKIGFQASLKLLRAGAQVIATTRFPIDAIERYAKESDYRQFRERLEVFGLDLRHTPSVELFAQFLEQRLPRLDYLLNNACQTVRRPAGFFAHLLARESQPLDALPLDWRNSLASHTQLKHSIQHSRGSSSGALLAAGTQLPGDGVLHSAALSQRRYLDEDYHGGEALFPADRFDEDLQQVDLREVNSWRLRMHEVETPELLEVQLVNAIAPYVLNARLKPLLLKTLGAHKHIVNVSAVEGQFYRHTKTDKHPHTNMAKAALNMMTRTSAPDFVKDGIHMNAVDTGWVTDEDPAAHAARKAELGFAPPLDIIDGAARIVDPIFSGKLSGTHFWGQFLKDYKPAPW
jgi:NAD(P)-dependent dehydrogenase (short-subunit alcohol dehydrogenase family)